MSLAEILDELPSLTPQQRQQVVEKVFELQGDWLDGDDCLGVEERRLIDSRLTAHDQDPDSAVPWQTTKARLMSRFTR